MKKLLMITLLLSNLIGTGFASDKVETYEDLVKKEEKMRELEKENFEQDNSDNYDEEAKKQEEADRKEEEREEKEAQEERDLEVVEVKDNAGYDNNNMDEIRENGHRIWDQEQAEFDKPNK